MAMDAPAEKFAYVALLNPREDGADALGVIDLDPASERYGQQVSVMAMPNAGDELHHFGWNACSACLCPNSPHPHMERRYLIVPGLRSSRIHIVDTKPDPTHPRFTRELLGLFFADAAFSAQNFR
jgi:selenium-binding protein 1